MIIKSYQNYLIKTFLKELFLVFIVFLSLIFILNVLSEIRFFINYDVNSFYPIFLTLLNVPSIVFEIFPFIFLISTQLFFVKLHEKNELIILKNYGVDNLKVIIVLLITSLVVGFLITSVYYTFSASLKHSYLFFKNQYSNDNKYLAVVNENGLWIKDETINNINIINADSIINSQLNEITISQLDKSFNLVRTIRASSANINNKIWELKEASIIDVGSAKKKFDSVEFKTNFDIEKINSMFSDLSSLNLFELIELYNDYSIFGYSTTGIESSLHKLYSFPIYLTIMTIIGTILMFNMKSNNSKIFNIIIGIMVSVFVYYLNYFISLLGKNEYIPIYISIWISQLILFLICIIGTMKINEK